MTWKHLVRGSAHGPWGLLGAVILALGCETWIAWQGISLSSLAKQDHRQSTQRIAHVQTGVVLCLGDSLVKCGMCPQVLEARLGRRTVNAAVAGSTAPYSYFMLKRVLDSGARPALVIVDFKPIQLQANPRDSVDVFSEALQIRECAQIAWTLNDSTFFGWTMMRKSLPSVRTRGAIRSVLSMMLAGQENPTARNILPHLRNWSVNHGASMMDKNPKSETTAEHWDEAMSQRLGRFRANLTNAEYVRRFLKLAAAHDVPVYWLVPPISPRLRATRDRDGADVDYVAMLRRAVTQYPKLTVVDGQYSGYPTRVFVDATHLDVEGAYTLSVALAEQIKADAPERTSRTGRWWKLPEYRPVAIEIPLEDFAASQAALFGAPVSPSDTHREDETIASPANDLPPRR